MRAVSGPKLERGSQEPTAAEKGLAYLASPLFLNGAGLLIGSMDQAKPQSAKDVPASLRCRAVVSGLAVVGAAPLCP